MAARRKFLSRECRSKQQAEYLRRLVQQGFRVSICEQTEDPKFAKGIVRREVVETVTPGAAYADDMLDGSRNNFLCAVHSSEISMLELPPRMYQPESSDLSSFRREM